MGLLGGDGGDGINIVPVNEPEDWLVREACHAVETRYGLETTVAEPLSLPREAYDPERNQYDAERMLEAVGSDGPRSTDWLAVTGVDLYYNRNNYVFGSAFVGGEGAVASVDRLEAGDDDTTRDRWRKQVLKQVGHVLGAERCEDKHCLFSFSPTVRELDVQQDIPCGACRRELEAEGVTVETGAIGEAPARMEPDPSARAGDSDRSGERATPDDWTDDDRAVDARTGSGDSSVTRGSDGGHVTAPTEADIKRARSEEPEETDSRSESVDDIVSGLRFQAVVLTFLVLTVLVLIVEVFLYDLVWGFDSIPDSHTWGLIAVGVLVALSLTRRVRAAAGRVVAYVRF